ncbi:MAG TPA: hypothetical protein VF407_21600 [Polyangiaceae bacterium]
MSELSKETRDLLTRGRGGTNMPSRRRAAIKGAVLAKVAAGTVVTTSATAAAWTTTTKAIGMAAVALAVGGGTVGVVKYESAKAEREKAAAVTATTNAIAAKPPIADLPQNKPDPQPIPVALPAEPEATTAAPIPEVDRPNANAISNAISNPSSNAISNTKPSASSSLAEQASIVYQAHQADMSGHPEAAIALCDDYARRFPTGPLAQECAAERVFSFCTMHDTDAARAAASSFLAAHPDGPISDRVRTSCGGTK